MNEIPIKQYFVGWENEADLRSARSMTSIVPNRVGYIPGLRNVLVAEQELYKREALPWVGLPLPDSTPVAKQHWCCSAFFCCVFFPAFQEWEIVGIGLDDYAQLETSLIG